MPIAQDLKHARSHLRVCASTLNAWESVLGGSNPPPCTKIQSNHTMRNLITGVEYAITGDSIRANLSGYHRGPAPRDLSTTPWAVDTIGVRKDLILPQWESKFTLGMEVEKNFIETSEIREYALFKGFEQDASCGVEAITNILPLLPESRWRDKVFGMMDEASPVLNAYDRDRDSRGQFKCGGHITLGMRGVDGTALLGAMRPMGGLIMSLYHKRLENSYCNENQRLSSHYHGSRYQVALVKGNLLEWRIFSKVSNVETMKQRYELCFAMLEECQVLGSLESLVARKDVKDILLRMYDGDRSKVTECVKRARIIQRDIIG